MKLIKETGEAYLAEPPEKKELGLALIKDGLEGDALGKLLRYETTLTNTLARTVSMLITLQNTRRLGADEQTSSVNP